MDAIGGESRWRKRRLELDLQQIELLDLERSGNFLEKVAHIMWKKPGRKIRGWTMIAPDFIVRGNPTIGLGHGVGMRRIREEAVLALFGTNSFFTLFKTWLSGELVGEDAYGNRYYRERKTARGRRERRWVMYSQAPEPTRVPPGWVGWLHGRIAEPPSDAPLPSPHFEAEPLPNLTGTTEAYLPPGAMQRGGTRARATGDYEAWRPE